MNSSRQFFPMSLEHIVEESAQGFVCSQMVMAHASQYGLIDENTARRLGAVFGWGMYNGERCGAVVAAMMALSLKYGNDVTQPLNPTLFQNINVLEQQIVEQFGSFVCADILGAACHTPEERDKARAEKRTKHCAHIIKTCCDILDELLTQP